MCPCDWPIQTGVCVCVCVGGGGGGGGVCNPTFTTGWFFYYGVSTRHSCLVAGELPSRHAGRGCGGAL